MDARTQYQVRRRKLLLKLVDLDQSTGLEIGACDLPTVGPGFGSCQFADFRSSQEMIDMWNLPNDSVMPVSFLLSRVKPLDHQISARFDYVIACHVLEHIPDPISYILELKALLRPQPGGVIFITLPDKRTTLDATRPSTTIERLVANFHENVKRPHLADVLEFHRHWVGYANGPEPLRIREAYDYAKTAILADDVDAHCNVWEDEECRLQIQQLIEGGFLPGLRISLFEPNFLGTNEFAIGLSSE